MSKNEGLSPFRGVGLVLIATIVGGSIGAVLFHRYGVTSSLALFVLLGSLMGFSISIMYAGTLAGIKTDDHRY